jgi:hypothetical protein
MITLNKTLRLFLDSIGRRDEYEFYLDKFRADSSSCFAVLCPDTGTTETAAEVLGFDLHFLMRLELVPVILLSGVQAGAMKKALAKEPIFTFKRLHLESDTPSIIPFMQQARRDEQVPVLVSDQELEESLLALLPTITKRLHFIRAAGGLRCSRGELMDYVYTHKENERILEPLELDYPALARRLLDERPGVHLSVTSPINLLQEIFTVKGAGTVFRKGSQIEHHAALAGVDEGCLIELLEESFGKVLVDRAFLGAVKDCYLEANYRGAVLLEEQPAGLYLSKFSVGKEARGEGVAIELWREVCRNHEAFFWRSNRDNPFNSWYDKQADGRHAIGKWQIFWRGVSPEAISGIVAFCAGRGEDFGPCKG